MTGIALALSVAAAGGIGSAVRHLVDAAVPARRRFPWALLIINASGSFTLGLVVAVLDGATWHAVIGTGVLGGYTTFSSASLDAAVRWVEGERSAAVRSALAMVLACLLAATVGVAVGNTLGG